LKEFSKQVSKRQEGHEELLAALKRLGKVVEYVDRRAQQFEETQKVWRRISGKTVSVTHTHPFLLSLNISLTLPS